MITRLKRKPPIMTDVFSVTAAYDKPSYNKGDTITVTISGNDILTTITTVQIGPLTIPVVAADGAVSTVTLPQTIATQTVATPESVVIDTTTPIVDTSPTPHIWIVSANKLSASTIA